MWLCVQKEAPLRQMIDLRLGPDFDGEQAIVRAADRLAQWRWRACEQRIEYEPLEPATRAEQFARCDVAEGHGAPCIREEKRERRGLDHGVEQQLALVKIDTLAAQYFPERIVGVDQFAQLVVRSARDRHTEIAIAQARNSIAQRDGGLAPAAHRTSHRKPACKGTREEAAEYSRPG